MKYKKLYAVIGFQLFLSNTNNLFTDMYIASIILKYKQFVHTY